MVVWEDKGAKRHERGIFEPNRCAMGVLWAKNLLGHARKVGYHLSVVRLNFCSHLGGQTGKTMRTGHFMAKLV